MYECECFATLLGQFQVRHGRHTPVKRNVQQVAEVGAGVGFRIMKASMMNTFAPLTPQA